MLDTLITIKKIKKMYLLKSKDDFVKWLNNFEKDEEISLKLALKQVNMFIEDNIGEKHGKSKE
jgi:hypothetical protein